VTKKQTLMGNPNLWMGPPNVIRMRCMDDILLNAGGALEREFLWRSCD
jgi:hypothetical protein